MDGDFGVDLGAIVEHVETAETFSIFFPTLRRALVVDMRHGPEEGPLVRVLPMARSPQERLRSLRRLRPYLPRATQMVAIPWPTYVVNMVRSGVWSKLAARITESGSALDFLIYAVNRLDISSLVDRTGNVDVLEAG